jgi:hypothetical protein
MHFCPEKNSFSKTLRTFVHESQMITKRKVWESFETEEKALEYEGLP